MIEGQTYRVRGRVQGVWFRESTRREAERLELTGHAINLPDGSVEVVAFGAGKALQQLESWLHRGPRLARVTSVESAPAGGEPPIDFTTG